MQLVEEATEGCWIGHRARMFTSEIGSVYSPPKQDRHAIVVPSATQHVETVIDIGHNRGVCRNTRVTFAMVLTGIYPELGFPLRKGWYTSDLDERVRK